jgi:hypothetical protein
MRAHAGYVEYAGLRRFVAEDVLPGDVLRDLVRAWAPATSSVVLAVVDEEIRRALIADHPDAA